MIHRFSWLAIGRALCAGLRAIAGPVMPLPATVEADLAPLTAADVEEFVRKLDDGVIDASDFTR